MQVAIWQGNDVNEQQQKAALPTILSLARQEASKGTAASQLIDLAGMNPSSAKMFVDSFVALCNGTVFKRAFSEEDLRWLLQSVHAELGRSALARALSALELHIRYREDSGVNVPGLIEIHREFSDRSSAGPITEAESFADQVEKSRTGSGEARRARLQAASKTPRVIEKLVRVYERNPDVVAEVLEQADGDCGICGSPAPFTRRVGGRPYLEVHHRRPLAEGGDDSVENAVAACPNCHRKQHYG